MLVSLASFWQTPTLRVEAADDVLGGVQDTVMALHTAHATQSAMELFLRRLVAATSLSHGQGNTLLAQPSTTRVPDVSSLPPLDVSDFRALLQFGDSAVRSDEIGLAALRAALDDATTGSAATPSDSSTAAPPFLARCSPAAAARLAACAFTAATATDARAAAQATRLGRELQALLRRIAVASARGSSGAANAASDPLVALAADAVAKLLRMDAQRPLFALLAHARFPSGSLGRPLAELLDTRSRLVVLDLAHCLLGDAVVVSAVVPRCARLMHLRAIGLSNNALTCAAADALLSLACGGIDNDCPALLALDVAAGNALGSTVEAGIVAGLTARLARARATQQHEAEGGAASVCLAPLRVVSFDGAGMKSCVQPTLLQAFASSRATPPINEAFDVFVGSSMGAVVAAGFAFGLSPQQLTAFFVDVAESVFAVPAAVVSRGTTLAVRAVRSWWTGGDYYSGAAMRAALDRLFCIAEPNGAAGETTGAPPNALSKPVLRLRDLPRSVVIAVAVAAGGSGATSGGDRSSLRFLVGGGADAALRIALLAAANSTVPRDGRTSNNTSEHHVAIDASDWPLIDVLHAAVAAPSLFGPVPLPLGGGPSPRMFCDAANPTEFDGSARAPAHGATPTLPLLPTLLGALQHVRRELSVVSVGVGASVFRVGPLSRPRDEETRGGEDNRVADQAAEGDTYEQQHHAVLAAVADRLATTYAAQSLTARTVDAPRVREQRDRLHDWRLHLRLEESAAVVRRLLLASVGAAYTRVDTDAACSISVDDGRPSAVGDMSLELAVSSMRLA